MAIVFKEVEIEVEMDDFDDEDIRDEFEFRGLALTDPVIDERIEEIFYAFKFNQEARASELARLFVCDVLGKIL